MVMSVYKKLAIWNIFLCIHIYFCFYRLFLHRFAHNIWHYLDKLKNTSQLTFNVCVLNRFVGTTSESTDLFPFLQNLTQHIKKAKGEYAFKVEVGVDLFLCMNATSLPLTNCILSTTLLYMTFFQTMVNNYCGVI